jgi:hypothetical protein
MCQKAMYPLSIILVFVLTGNIPAATYEWDNGGEGALWNVAGNWNPDGVPAAGDTAQVFLEDANCLIDSSIEAECSTLSVGTGGTGPCYVDMTGGSLTLDGHLRVGEGGTSTGFFNLSAGTIDSVGGRLWVGINGTGTLTMTDGEMNFYDKIEIGKNANGVGTLYIHGGTVNFDGNGNSTDLEIGKYGTGSIYMTGGVINVEDQIKLGQESGSGSLYLHGGTINTSNIRAADQILGTALIDITEGVLTLAGNDTEVVNDYISRGWIVGYGGLGIVEVTYASDLNQTVVTASNLPPELAQNPDPHHLTTVNRTTDGPILSWTPGMYAVSHDVYFGMDPNAVHDANNETDADNVALWAEFKGNQTLTSYDPGPLELGQTYYWRIDEVNEPEPNSPWIGSVWEFTVADHIVVDDFESYNDIAFEEEGSNLIYMTWVDGFENPTVNGSTIGYVTGNSLETDNVHGGQQSAPISYDNTTATYSEVTVSIEDLSIDSDWTKESLKTLSLWFYGSPVNAATVQMYVKVNDAEVTYDGSLNVAMWQEWSIDLADFNTDLSNVTIFGIGFRRTGAIGNRGSILLDDIRLHVSEDQ